MSGVKSLAQFQPSGPLMHIPSALKPVVVALALAAGWGLLVGERARIARAAPVLAPVYAALGLGASPPNMEIEGVASRLVEDGGRVLLVVEGEIRNPARATGAPPPLRLAVLDAQGRELYFWTAEAPKTRLAAGEKAFFRARLVTPPPEGRQVQVRFAGAKHVSAPGS